MVDTTRAIEGEYVNVDLIRSSTTKKAVVLNEGEFKEKTFNEKKYEQFEILVEIDKKKKLYAPNKDCANNLAQAWGTDSAAWVGKTIRFSIIKKAGKDTINAVADA